MKLNVFISCYTEKSDDLKWITEFSATIKLLISKIQKIDAEIITSFNITNDDKYSKIAPAEVFSNMDVFLIILTNNYLKSTKSNQELATITSINKDGIFKILIEDVPKNEQDEKIRKLSPIILYEKDDYKTLPVNLNKIENYLSLRNYWLRLIDLSYSIDINKLKSKSESAKTIFLAETGYDQIADRETIKRELLHFGHTVLPGKLLTDGKNNFEKEVLSYLEQSDISIHIVGSDEGRVLEDKRSVVFQSEIAADYCDKNKKPLDRLIWIPPDLVFDNDNQRINIEKLKRNSNILKDAELVQTPIEDFKTLIHKHINIKFKDSSETKSQSRSVYLMYIDKNKNSIKDVELLLNKNNIKTFHLDHLSDKRQLLRNHRENIIKCDGLMIFSDGNNNGWVESMQKDIIKSVGFGRKKPILTKSIFKTTNKDVITSFTDDFLIINGAGSVNDNILNPFVEKLKESG